MKLKTITADPAGNITVFVLSDIASEKRAPVASSILESGFHRAEQVGYIVSPLFGGDCRLEMMGGEFCGNAMRSAALVYASMNGIHHKSIIHMECSGASGIFNVIVDPEARSSNAFLPLPERIVPLSCSGLRFPAVCLPGIVHVIANGYARNTVLANKLISSAMDQYHAEAVGVMFLSGNRLTPVVYVNETNSIVWESSCASGSGSVAAYLSHAKSTNIIMDLIQPGGIIRAEAYRNKGKLISLSIGGAVTLSPISETNF